MAKQRVEGKRSLKAKRRSARRVTQVNKTSGSKYEYKSSFLMPKHFQIGNDFLNIAGKMSRVKLLVASYLFSLQNQSETKHWFVVFTNVT